MEKSPRHQKKSRTEMTKGEADDDHISKLSDDALVRILSLLLYKEAVQTASVSRRWRDVVRTQLSDLTFDMSLVALPKSSIATPSEQRVQSMERTLRRRCGEGGHGVKSLTLRYRKDVPMECRYADEFIALANAHRLNLVVQYDLEAPEKEEDDGAWSLELPSATTELHMGLFWYSVRLPHIRGSGVGTLRSLKLSGLTVLRQDFLLTELPSLEDLHIRECTLAASIHITSDTMPRLRHLDITDIRVKTKDTKAEINVLVDELRTLRVSCCWASDTRPFDEMEAIFPCWRFKASFTTYSSFRLRAPRLQVFDWRCAYADEVCIENVGHLWNVVVELAAGRKARQINEKLSCVTVDQRDKLMRDILQGLMPGLRPLDWEDAKRRCVQRDHRWVCFEMMKAYGVTQ